MPSASLGEVNITNFTKAQGEEIRTFLLNDFHKTEPLNASLEVPSEDVLDFYKSKSGSLLSRSTRAKPELSGIFAGPFRSFAKQFVPCIVTRTSILWPALGWYFKVA